MKIFIFAALALSLNANSFLDYYRLYGTKNIEKQLDKALGDTAYWGSVLKDKETKFGYLEGFNYILTCNKQNSKLSLYKKNQNSLKLNQEFFAYTGKNKGDKTEEGDYKTPNGVYEITKKIDKLDAFYGPLAFVTSYPNEYDKFNGKNGSGIWIHGLPTEQKRDEYTKGCIAIENNNLLTLDKEIAYDKTLLIIHDGNKIKEVSKEQLSSIIAQLFTWRYHWIYNNIDEYLSFYANDFKNAQGLNLSQFREHKRSIFQKQEEKQIIFENLNIVTYPTQKDNLFKVTFFEKYKSPSYTFNGEKTLMIRYKNDKKIEIFTEK